MCIINIFFKNTVNIIVIVVHLLAELFCIVPLIGKVLFNCSAEQRFVLIIIVQLYHRIDTMSTKKLKAKKFNKPPLPLAARAVYNGHNHKHNCRSRTQSR